VLDLFREVESRLPNNTDLRLSIAAKELRKDVNGQQLLNQYAKHTSQVVVMMRAKGGSDYSSRIPMLYDQG